MASHKQGGRVRGHGVAIVTLVILTFATPVSAQNTEAMAQTLFEQGRALMAEGKTAQACDKFEQSRSLQSKVGTLLNLAVCREKMGLTATAWANFKSAATLARRSEQPEREAFAKARIAEVAAKMAYLTINLPEAPEGTTLMLDGAPYAMGMVGTALPIDPGDHVVVASAPGKTQVEAKVTIAVGPARVSVDLPAFVDAPSAQPQTSPLPSPSPAPSNLPGEDTTTSESAGISPLVFIGFGVGLAGLGVGAITGAMTLAQSADLDDSCQNAQCGPDAHDDLDAATTLSHVSTAGFIVGAVGVGVGIVGLVLSDFGDDADTARLTLSPTGLALQGTF